LGLRSVLNFYLGKCSHLDGELGVKRLFQLSHLITLACQISNGRVQLRLYFFDVTAFFLYLLVCLYDLLLQAVVFLLNRAYFYIQIGRLLLLHPYFFLRCCHFFFEILNFLIRLLDDLFNGLVQLVLLRLDLVLQLSGSFKHIGLSLAIKLSQPHYFVLFLFERTQ